MYKIVESTRDLKRHLYEKESTFKIWWKHFSKETDYWRCRGVNKQYPIERWAKATITAYRLVADRWVKIDQYPKEKTNERRRI